MKAFTIFLLKELKSIARDPKIIIGMIIAPIVLIAVLYGFMGSAMRQQIEEAVKASGAVVLIDLDHGNWTQSLAKHLEAIGLNITHSQRDAAPSVDEMVELMEEKRAKILYVVPRGFSRNLTEMMTGVVECYVLIKSLSFTEMGIASSAESYIRLFSESISRSILVNIGVSESFAKNPVLTSSRVVLAGKVFESPQALLNLVLSLSFIMPLLAVMFIVFISQYAVMAMAVEKEEKMFETLLSLPINRTTIIAVKLLISIIIGLATMGVYAGIFIWFFSSMVSSSFEGRPQGQVGISGESINLFELVKPESIVLILIGLASVATFVLSLLMLVSLFAEDVRTAQTFTGIMIFPVVFAAYAAMFIDIAVLSPSATITVSMIPVLNTAMSIKFSVMGDTLLVALANLSNLAYATITIVALRSVVRSERVFTAKLSLKPPGRIFKKYRST
ncbi:MAG: ABC transporter permease [Sulfolobales archaeon]|nr:ABC transporter permease [Sulfolobales archaeon]MCX8198748.1 ABC transporter permease [Sulfolobales archaeon]MDW8169821.1 ABC transporter permease [Desulfurococcaceae archaeon]